MRLFALSSISCSTIRFVLVVSCIGSGFFAFTAASASAAECDSIVDITKESNSTKATQQNFEKLLGCIKELQSQMSKVQNASGRITVNGTDGSVAGSAGEIEGLSGTFSLDNDKFVQCPPGSFVSAIQGFKTSNGLMMQIRYACRSVK